VCSIEYLTTQTELVLPTFKSWTVCKIIEHLTLRLCLAYEISTTVQKLTFFDPPCISTHWKSSTYVFCVALLVQDHYSCGLHLLQTRSCFDHTPAQLLHLCCCRLALLVQFLSVFLKWMHKYTIINKSYCSQSASYKQYCFSSSSSESANSVMSTTAPLAVMLNDANNA